MTDSQAFIVRLDAPGDGVRLAVKDAIDVAGVPTTVGSRVVAGRAVPAVGDAACLAGARAAGARIVGKANLHELCFGRTGVNPWFGTPVNPLAPDRVPGGSSSGSAVAVAPAVDEADIAFGTDTAGSIRNPAAWCGVVGLKTTWGRVSLDGVWPLAPSLDTIGPLASTVAAVSQGMALLEPGFAPGDVPTVVGRVRGLDADQVIDAAVDAALAAAGFEVVDVVIPGWLAAHDAGMAVLFGEALTVNRVLIAEHGDELGADLIARFATSRAQAPGAVEQALARRAPWRAELAEVFGRVEVLALPSAERFAPVLEEVGIAPSPMAIAVNLAGHPAICVPVPSAGPFLASVQLVGPDGSEERLVAAGAVVEAAAATL